MSLEIYNDIVRIRESIVQGLPPHLSDDGLEEITINSNALKLMNSPKTMAIYPSLNNPLREEEDATVFDLVIDFYCNSRANSAGIEEMEQYYASIYDYLARSDLGEYSTIVQSAQWRVDTNAGVNACSFLVEIRLKAHCDFDFA